MTKVSSLLKLAATKDAADSLSTKKRLFDLPAGMVYLDGNSLGPLTHAAKQRAVSVVEQQWGQDLITSWNKHQWIDLPVKVGEKIAPLIGAGPEQVICCDSISVNLFKLLSAALAMRPERHKVLSTIDNFPTDRYMVQGFSDARVAPDVELISVSEADIVASIDDSIAVVMLTQVNFKTGYRLDMRKVTEKAHQHGCLVIWDLAHSAGILPVELDACQADFAVGCGYKYLNGGPGAPAFVYVAKRHQQHYRQPLQGWMGHANPFTFDPDYQAHQSIKQNLVGTPSVVSMSLLDAALDAFDETVMFDIANKGLDLAEWFICVLNKLQLDKLFEHIGHFDRNHSGAQVALHHPHAYAICQAWVAKGVVADFRAPNVLRVGFSPLFLSFQDIVIAAERLADVMQSTYYLNQEFQIKQAVT